MTKRAPSNDSPKDAGHVVSDGRGYRMTGRSPGWVDKMLKQHSDDIFDNGRKPLPVKPT